jgi:hypothetical protein
MSELKYSQSLQSLGPYYISPGEPAWLGWNFTPGGNVVCCPMLQTNSALNVWFTIENITVMAYANDINTPPQYTQYGINIINNAPNDSQDVNQFVEVFVIVLTFYF